MGAVRCGAVVVVAAGVLAGVFGVGSASAQQTAAVFVDGAEPWTESGCAGEVPIVVGSDAMAQSDIYSAVALAGAVGTVCVVLAGPRGDAMAAGQRARLDAADAGGYIVGGTAAVPAAKTAHRAMTRIAGADRWATAALVGSEARALQVPDASAATTPQHAPAAPDDVAQPGVHLHGAEPWIASDCAGKTPIVVGSDPKAQSDIYSAVTLAGAVGTDCVILAGPRGDAMAASQRARLDTAATGGYVIGGTAAVPTAKLAGRDMTRIAGADRWNTAQLVGRRAAGDTATGTSTANEPTHNTPHTDTPTNNPTYTAITAGRNHTCALRTDKTITCWGRNTSGNKRFSDNIYSGSAIILRVVFDEERHHDCWVFQNSAAIGCSNNNGYGETDAPFGSYTAVGVGSEHSCGLRTDKTITCWGRNWNGEAAAPSGSYTAITVGWYHTCGLRTDKTITCWGNNDDGRADAPSGSYTAITSSFFHSCGLRTDKTITCWGRNRYGATDAPDGSYTAVTAGSEHSCGLRTDKTITCWGSYDDEKADAPYGSYTTADAPDGSYTAVTAGSEHSCALRTDKTITCWGNNRYGQADAPYGSYTAVAARGDTSCGVLRNGSIRCWGLGNMVTATR